MRVEHDAQLPEEAAEGLTVDPSEPITPDDVFNLIVQRHEDRGYRELPQPHGEGQPAQGRRGTRRENQAS